MQNTIDQYSCTGDNWWTFDLEMHMRKTVLKEIFFYIKFKIVFSVLDHKIWKTL